MSKEHKIIELLEKILRLLEQMTTAPSQDNHGYGVKQVNVRKR